MRKILFVDDNKIFRKQLSSILCRLERFELVEFEFGKDLVDYYRQQTEHEQDSNVILIDCVMSDMSGFETLKNIISINDNASVAMMTGKSPRNVRDGIKLGVKSFIWKPFDAENIMGVLNDILSNQL